MEGKEMIMLIRECPYWFPLLKLMGNIYYFLFLFIFSFFENKNNEYFPYFKYFIIKYNNFTIFNINN